MEGFVDGDKVVETVGRDDGIHVVLRLAASGQREGWVGPCDGEFVGRVIGFVVGDSEAKRGGADGGSSMLRIHSQVGLAKALDGSGQDTQIVSMESDTTGR